jgi:PHD/YefM family antitoxin component YafN of YafNO toxin-antitoxin module
MDILEQENLLDEQDLLITKTMKKKIIITSKKRYHETMAGIYDLMNKGEANLTKSELERVRQMAAAAELYEDETLELRPFFDQPH